MAVVDSGAQGPAGVTGPQGAVQPTSGPFAGLTPIVAKQVAALIAASHGKVRLVSGHRTLQEQQALYAQAVQRYGENNAAAWVADPANSNHVKGSAADFAGDLTILSQLAPQFGLVAPMSWEPWHLEMASTPQHASPLAYTTPPPGESNPTTADRSTSVPHTAAALAEAVLPLATNGLGANGNPSLGNPAKTGDLGNILEGVAPEDQGAQPAAAPQGPNGAASTTSLGGANIPTGKGDVAPNQLYNALIAAGVSPAMAAAGVSIAGRESGYNTSAFNGNTSTGDQSYGLFQINLLHGGWTDFLKAHGMSDPADQLRTLQGSVEAFAAITGSSGLHPWGGYKGLPWSYNTSLQAGADASGGAVSVQDLQALGGG